VTKRRSATRHKHEAIHTLEIPLAKGGNCALNGAQTKKLQWQSLGGIHPSAYQAKLLSVYEHSSMATILA
jgi:hypothetical protein